MTIREDNVFRYSATDLNAAKSIIVTPQADAGVEQRWTLETDATATLFRPLIPSEGTVLDYGCGAGRLIPHVLRESPKVRVIAADTSPTMLGHARQLISSQRPGDISRVHFLLLEESTTLKTTVLPDSVDLVLCVYVLQHVSAGILPGLIEDLWRVLRTGGRMFVLNLNRRSVPRVTGLETQAATDAERNQAIESVASHATGREEAWADDRLDVKGLLTARFGKSNPLALTRPDFSSDLIRDHFCATYTKGR